MKRWNSKMQCCVPFCNNASDNVSTSLEEKKISFHGFPSVVHLRAVWLKALGKQDSHLLDSAVVCSQHFLNDDIYESESGIRLLDISAIPSTVQVCTICLDTDSKMFLMSKHKLEEAYEKLTGHPLCDQGNLKQTVCVQCAQRLINFIRFRDKSLRARELMMDLVEKHELITRQHIKEINRTKHQLTNNMVLTMLGPDHCDLHILEHPSEDKQAELEESGQKVVVKTEESDHFMSVDEGMVVTNQDEYDNANNFVQYSIEFERFSFQCTLCLEEYIDEHSYTQHVCMNLENHEGEYDTSQVCKPHTAVSSSPSSLITEDKSLILHMPSDGGKKRQEDSEELVGAVSSDKYQGAIFDEIVKKRRLQNRIKCKRYRDKRKRDATNDSRISKHQTITVEEDIKIKLRKEKNKQKSKRYRDKKRANKLINLQTDQPSKTTAKHVPEGQNFHISQIPGPSTRNVPYIPPTHTPGAASPSIQNELYILEPYSDYDANIQNDIPSQVNYVPQLVHLEPIMVYYASNPPK